VLGAVADIPDNGIALTAYDASANGQDLSAQFLFGLAFSLNDMHIQRIEWLFGVSGSAWTPRSPSPHRASPSSSLRRLWHAPPAALQAPMRSISALA
jgi:hypothetical protein